MSLYAIVEHAVVVLLAVVSLFYVLRTVMPKTVSRAQSLFAAWLDRPWSPQLVRALARRVAPSAASGCGAGCGSACNGCGESVSHQSVISPPATRKGNRSI